MALNPSNSSNLEQLALKGLMVSTTAGDEEVKLLGPEMVNENV